MKPGHLQLVTDKNLPAAPTPEAAWAQLPEAKRAVAIERKTLVDACLARAKPGISVSAAVDYMLTAIETGHAPMQLIQLAKRLGRNGTAPNRATLHRWIADYKAGGIVDLAPGHKGSTRKTYGWEVRAVRLWQQPTKPDMATVAFWLRDEGWETATNDRVARFLKSLPATVGKKSAARMGQHYYRQNLRGYVLRDETVLPVGLVYEGDGHNCDVYIAHPATGKPWRPEFTPWIDVRSHYCVGWYISEAESGITTLFSLSHALVSHSHVCAAVHVDPGSGFKARLMTNEVFGYLARFDIEFMAALPGNAKGKGLTERFFGIFEERVGKKFATYCGADRTDDYLRHLSAKVARGEIELPTLAQYRDAIAAYIERYNNTYQDRLGCTPAELWAQLERVPLEMSEAAIIRPREQRTVQRWSVTLFNRMYRHPDLAHYNDRQVLVEYDLHNDQVVTIRDLQGRFICDAPQVDRKAWMPLSRIEELQQKRLRGQIRRKEIAIEEDKARAGLAITHDQVLDGIKELTGGNTPVPVTQAGPIDLLSSLPGADTEKGDSLRLTPFDFDAE